MPTNRVAVVGGGIVGVAVAREILRRRPDTDVTIFERRTGSRRTRPGATAASCTPALYYEPGSNKALLPPRRRPARRVLRGSGIRRSPAARFSRPRRRRACAAGQHRGAGSRQRCPRRSDHRPEELCELEHVHGVAALHHPSTSIVNFAEVTQALATDAVADGRRYCSARGRRSADISTEVRVTARSASGSAQFVFDQIVACGGLQSDRLAELAGDGPDPRSCLSAASTTRSSPSDESSSTGSSTRCPTPLPVPRCACHPGWTGGSHRSQCCARPDPHPPGERSPSLIWSKWRARRRSGASLAGIGGPASGRCTGR